MIFPLALPPDEFFRFGAIKKQFNDPKEII
jgi:hypothetical protein